jgi:hypothetical protein
VTTIWHATSKKITVLSRNWKNATSVGDLNIYVRTEVALLRVKEQRNILHEISKRKAKWVCHILRRNCLLWQVIEGKIKGGIEVTGRRGRRRRKLLDDLKEMRGYSRLKEEALDRPMWRVCFGRGFGPVVRQTTKWMNEYSEYLCIYFRTLHCDRNVRVASPWASTVNTLLTNKAKRRRREWARGRIRTGNLSLRNKLRELE